MFYEYPTMGYLLPMIRVGTRRYKLALGPYSWTAPCHGLDDKECKNDALYRFQAVDVVDLCPKCEAKFRRRYNKAVHQFYMDAMDCKFGIFSGGVAILV